MFSLTSASDEAAPPRNWPQAPSPPSRPIAASTLGRHHRSLYGTNEQLELEQPYEIPLPGGLPLVNCSLKRGRREFDSEIIDTLENNDEVRVNPLYSTSEDEL